MVVEQMMPFRKKERQVQTDDLRIPQKASHPLPVVRCAVPQPPLVRVHPPESAAVPYTTFRNTHRRWRPVEKPTGTHTHTHTLLRMLVYRWN